MDARAGDRVLARADRAGRRSRHISILLAAVLLGAGCASPIGVKRLELVDANRAVNANVLSTGAYSAYAGSVLRRQDLAARFEEAPAGALAELHAGLGGVDEMDRLLALSELSFLHATRSGDRTYFMASAAYAWAFLFPECTALQASPYEDRLRLAADLYNRAIALGLSGGQKSELVDLAPRTIEIFFGPLDLRVASDELMYAGYRLERFVSLADFSVRGLRNRYRRRGIGAPLAASVSRVKGVEAYRWIGANAKIPVTLLVRFDEVRSGLASGRLTATLQLRDPDLTEFAEIDGAAVPLESDATAALAYALNESPIWDFETEGFRRGSFRIGDMHEDSNLIMLEPYRRGLIPVVFVHGTVASPARWAEMANELMSDHYLGARYQLWFFIYNTGNPIAVSAAHLRESLRSVIATVDPTAEDPALRRMVLIGHSQGGLLAKLMVVDSGSRFWDAVASVPFADAELSQETRAALQEALFVAPQPHVTRVVFIATPHRGSFLAERLLGNLARRLIRMPASMLHASVNLMRLDLTGVMDQRFEIPTSIDNMKHSDPFLRTLASLPMADGVRGHSIIAVRSTGAHADADDGVVAYRSAHIEGVDSETVVRWKHSVQSHPKAIEEVRRILYEHIAVEADAPTSPADEPCRLNRGSRMPGVN